MRKETFLQKGFLDLPKTLRRIDIGSTVRVLKRYSEKDQARKTVVKRYLKNSPQERCRF